MSHPARDGSALSVPGRQDWSRLFTAVVCLTVLFHPSQQQQQQQQQRLYFRKQDRCPGQVVAGEDNCPEGVTTKGRPQCGAECGRRRWCVSVVWSPDTGQCWLCNGTVTDRCDNTQPAGRLQHYDLRCEGQEERDSATCQCPQALHGPRCHIRMTDCADWKSAGYTGNRVVWIHPTLSPHPFPVLCHMTWNRVLLMKRSNVSVDFYRNWTQYVEGFGDVSGDHWLGLQRMHELTQSRCYTLGVQVTLANGTFYQRYYRHFKVRGEAELFAMDFNSTSPWGNPLGDCLSDLRAKPFSSYDADHDDDADGSCAERHHSGWWFGNCTACNPTGEISQPAGVTRTSEQQVFWTPGLGDVVPAKVMLMLRRC